MLKDNLNFSSPSYQNVKIYRPNQQGVALIVVLLFLILIMLAGVMAVRQSNTDLKTATADQINTTLLQSSDSANQKLEGVTNGTTNAQSYNDAISANGVFGSFILNAATTKNDEYVYCYNPRTLKFTKQYATVYSNGGTTINNGICNYNNADSYTSARQTVMTQVSVTQTPANANAEAYSHMVEGKDTENRSSQKFRFDIRATSVLPAYNEPKDSSGSCMNKSSLPVTTGTGTNTVLTSPILDCLHNSNTPSKMLYEQADLANISSSTMCVPFGKGTTSLNAKCVITSL